VTNTGTLPLCIHVSHLLSEQTEQLTHVVEGAHAPLLQAAVSVWVEGVIHECITVMRRCKSHIFTPLYIGTDTLQVMLCSAPHTAAFHHLV
jgi:hypothetical protein